MYTGVYILGGHAVRINSLFDEVHTLCADYRAEVEAEYVVETTKEHILYEKNESDKTSLKEHGRVIPFPPAYLETLAVYRQIANYLTAHCDTVLMHGCVIQVDDAGYMFTAPSGTGKTTHTRLWLQLLGERSYIVNGDKPLIHVAKCGVTAYGTPWDGKEHYSRNTSVPLRAIGIICRDTTNYTERLTPPQAFTEMLRATHSPNTRLETIKLMKLLENLLLQVPVFRIHCNMDLQAAQVAYHDLSTAHA